MTSFKIRLTETIHFYKSIYFQLFYDRQLRLDLVLFIFRAFHIELNSLGIIYCEYIIILSVDRFFFFFLLSFSLNLDNWVISLQFYMV